MWSSPPEPHGVAWQQVVFGEMPRCPCVVSLCLPKVVDNAYQLTEEFVLWHFLSWDSRVFLLVLCEPKCHGDSLGVENWLERSSGSSHLFRSRLTVLDEIRAMDLVVVTTFQDFDETLEKRLRGPGCDKKHSTQALVRHLARQADVRKVDLLILDWKSPPKQGPKEVSVSIGRGEPAKEAVWGSREQLLTKFPASVWDVCICSGSLRFILDFASQLKVKKRACMVHDYNLPFGPWGQEQSMEQIKEHSTLCSNFELLCASKHLSDFVEKWGEGTFRSRCCYAADYAYFDPVPEAYQPWEGRHSYVTFVSPCPEKGLSIFLRIAESLPEVQFLAVKTVAWTKPWHEQILKRLKNVKIQPATEKIEDILGITKVLLAPSVYPEAFGLVVAEAQLRGIPVVSTAICGLAEANQVPQTQVGDIPIVFDPRTHELVMGMTLEEAENTLSLDRPGGLTMEQWRQTAISQENYQKVAEEGEVKKVLELLQSLLGGGLQQASQDARIAASSFVDKRQGQFMAGIKKLLGGGTRRCQTSSHHQRQHRSQLHSQAKRLHCHGG
eukprot:Skav203108  [mRNA]  locus=scaffold447:378985:380643:+ [translate_table: standard]